MPYITSQPSKTKTCLKSAKTTVEQNPDTRCSKLISSYCLLGSEYLFHKYIEPKVAVQG